jgi:3-oxoacyl-[acyl-carrier-protein] synthase II
VTPDVVITGLGTVGPHGPGAEALAAGLAEGRTAFSPVDLSQGFHRAGSARMAGNVEAEALWGWLDRDRSRRMSLASRMAVVAARMALQDAGLERAELAGRDVPVCLGSPFGPNRISAKLLDQMRAGGPLSVSPLLFMESVANALAGQVALEFRLRGPNVTVVQREASGLLAVAEALNHMRASGCELALVGAADEFGPVTHAMLDRFEALSRGPTGECGRAFDAARDGFVVSEGATVLVLERAERAAARGARVQARVRAAVRANDPSATAAGWGMGHALLAGAARRGLERFGIAPTEVDRVVSGASGSRGGDRLEALHLRELFRGRELPAILAPKACVGEYGGGFLAAAVLALGPLEFGPTPGFETLDPELGIRPHDGRRLAPARHVLASSLASGGAAAWLVLGRA